MIDIETAVLGFLQRLPNANEQQAEDQADNEFGEYADQMEFMRVWRKHRDRKRELDQAKFKHDVDRWKG